MARVRYAIFKPSIKRIKLDRNIIAYGLVAIGFLIHFLPISINETLRIFYILSTFIIFLYFLTTSLWSYQPLNGKMQGEIEFMIDNISINGNVFRLSDIYAVHLHVEDYFGERKFYRKGNLNQTLQQGTKNFIQFIDTSNFQHKFYFKIDSKEDLEQLLPFIKRYNS